MLDTLFYALCVIVLLAAFIICVVLNVIMLAGLFKLWCIAFDIDTPKLNAFMQKFKAMEGE